MEEYCRDRNSDNAADHLQPDITQIITREDDGAQIKEWICYVCLHTWVSIG